MEEKKSKFDYGETIKIANEAPQKYHPSEIGFICGMIDIDSEQVAIASMSVLEVIGCIQWNFWMEVLCKFLRNIWKKIDKFDENANPYRDTGFTDHNDQLYIHPHQHKYKSNETGGTPKTGEAEPFSFWVFENFIVAWQSTSLAGLAQ